MQHPTQSIAQQVVQSILARKLQPGERLGEQALSDLFGVSRTLVREALMQLQARGFVQVHPRRGWFVVEPSVTEARDAFAARRVIETGLLQEQGRPLQQVTRQLRQHLAQEQAALEGADPATRAFLLADFHVCLAQSMGHEALSLILRDLTARTTLAATLYQSQQDANLSCRQHEGIVQALEAGDTALAAQLLREHLGEVEQSLSPSKAQPHDPLRERLQPIDLPSI
ncbi:GntR family transcriptional regulator [Comamonas sp. NoAH]|uniref:GntR family transcriptional regulator n=1 Tax=Comamonas halotolerans TaxID=3041496 RepID=UPI0024E05E2D|nr:GntR family transcriptional regulator [Comamonas sp. NoAH]